MAEVKRQDKVWIKKTLVSANNKSEYGLAALLSILKFHRFNTSLSQLRVLSGANEAGSNLFGLQKAAVELGFACKGYKMDAEIVKECSHPVILSIFTKAQQQDYVVLYGTVIKKGQTHFLIGHPADGLTYLSQRQLENLWVTKFCLLIEPLDSTKQPPATSNEGNPLILQLILAQKNLVAIILAIAILHSVLVIFPVKWAINQFFNRGLGDLDKLVFFGGFIVISLLIGINHFLRALNNRFSLLLAIPVVNTVYERIAKIFTRLPKTFLNSYHIEKHVYSQKQTQQIERSVNLITGIGTRNSIAAVISLVLLSFISYHLTLLAITFAILFFLWMNRKKDIILKMRHYIDEVHLNAEVASVENTRILLTGIEMDSAKNFWRRVKQMNNYLFSSNFSNSAKIQDYDSWAVLYCSFFSICSIGVSAYLYVGQILSTTNFGIACFLTTLLAFSFYELFKVASTIQMSNSFLQSLTELNSITTTSPSIDEKPVIINSIAIQQLIFNTPDYNKSIINNVSFSANRGQVTAVVGATGTGKSMLAEILLHQYSFASGSIMINEALDFKAIEKKAWSKLVAVVKQEPYIMPGTVMENIMMGDSNEDVNKFFNFLEEFRLVQFLQMFPKREQTHIGSGYLTISHGQKQIISLARALYCRPQLLILDDIFNQLSHEFKALAFFMIGQMKGNACVVLFTSDITGVESHCNEKFVM